jgi:hypothetical protein
MIQARGGGVRGAARYYNNRDRGYDYEYDARLDRLNALDSQNDNNRYYDYYNDPRINNDRYYYENDYYYDQ